MSKKKTTKKTAAPAARPKTAPKKAAPAAAYDGAPSKLADGAPVFVRWEQNYKLGILARYNANGKPVVCICAVDAKGKYTTRFGTERTFEPGEVSRVYMERDWESMSKPVEMTPVRAVEIMLQSATRLKQADIVAKLKDKEVLDRSKWMIDAVIAAANSNAGGASDYDSRMARGPATDELQRPRTQSMVDSASPVIRIDDVDVAEQVAEMILENKPLHVETLRSVGRWMQHANELLGDWKQKCDAFEAELEDLTRPSRARSAEVEKPAELRKNDIVILQLPRKQTERAKVTMVMPNTAERGGEMHFICIDGNGGSRPLDEEGKTWQRDPDSSIERFDKAVLEYETRSGKAKVTVSGAPERGSKIQILTGNTWSSPVDVLRIERDKVMFGKLGRDLKTDRIDGAYRTTDENTLWRRFDPMLERKPKGKADVVVTVDPNVAPWETGGGQVIDVPHEETADSYSSDHVEPALIAPGGPLDVKVGRKWERVTVTSVGSMLINFNGLDGTPGTAAWEDENKRWRRVNHEVPHSSEPTGDGSLVYESGPNGELARVRKADEPAGGPEYAAGVQRNAEWHAKNDDHPETKNDAKPEAGSMSGRQVEVKADGKWIKAVIVANSDDTIMTSRRDPNGTGIMSTITESFPLKSENKRWRLINDAARPANPLMQPKAAAKKIEQTRATIEKTGTAVVTRGAAAESPVARAVAASEVTMGNATQPAKTMTLQQRNIAEAKRRGIPLHKLVEEQEAKARQDSIEGTQRSERTSAGLDDGGFVSMPRLGDDVRIATLDGWSPTKVIALKPNAFIVSGGLVLSMKDHGTVWITGLPSDLDAQRERNARIIAAMSGPSATPIQDANAAADDEELALATRRELEALEVDDPEEPCPWDLPAVTDGVMEQGQPDYDEPAPWET